MSLVEVNITREQLGFGVQTQCVVCFGSLEGVSENAPRIIPCGHSICRACLKVHKKQKLVCPIDGSEYYKVQISEVPKNFALVEVQNGILELLISVLELKVEVNGLELGLNIQQLKTWGRQKNNSEIDDDFLCKVCFQTFDPFTYCPCVFQCGHTLCNQCIGQTLKNKAKCPICKKLVFLIPQKNFAMIAYLHILASLMEKESELQTKKNHLQWILKQLAPKHQIINETYTRDKYIGVFQQSRNVKRVVCIWSNNDRYIGDWCQGMIEGDGEIEYSNGDKYSGEWKKGVYSGFGTFKSANQETFYIGEWLAGKYNGYGINITKLGRFEGIWKDGLVNGAGTLEDNDGNVTISEWKDGKELGLTSNTTILNNISTNMGGESEHSFHDCFLFNGRNRYGNILME